MIIPEPLCLDGLPCRESIPAWSYSDACPIAAFEHITIFVLHYGIGAENSVVSPLAGEDVAIIVLDGALPVSFIVYPLAFVNVTRSVDIGPEATFFVLAKLTVVKLRFLIVDVFSRAVLVSIVPAPLVPVPVLINHSPLSLASALDKFSLVSAPRLLDVDTSAMHEILIPLPQVDILVIVVHAALAIPLVAIHGARVHVAIFVLHHMLGALLQEELLHYFLVLLLIIAGSFAWRIRNPSG